MDYVTDLLGYNTFMGVTVVLLVVTSHSNTLITTFIGV